MITVDTNVIASLLIDSEHSPAAARALMIDREWTAPILWRSEFQNVLAMAVRLGHYDLETALQSLEASEALMRGGELQPAGVDVLRLANESGCSAYDCSFVAVAVDLRVPLVTLDQGLLMHFSDLAVSLTDFVG